MKHARATGADRKRKARLTSRITGRTGSTIMSIDVQAPPEAATASTITEGAYQLDTMDRDTNIGRLVHRVRHALVTNIDSALASLDLTAAQWTVVL